ncbi:MAG: UDP-N-acetylmuramate dehydrogenase, partial [Actinobacteria bacterium]
SLGRPKRSFEPPAGTGSERGSSWRRSRRSASAGRPPCSSSPSRSEISWQCPRRCVRRASRSRYSARVRTSSSPTRVTGGLVLRLGRGYRWSARDGDRLTAGGAMPLPALAGVALAHGLAGLEFGVAIPASLGGAVRMNAGAHGGSLADVIESVDVFGLSDGSTRRVPADEAGLSYRRSALAPDGVVVGATVRLGAREPAEIRARMDEAREWRRRTQPLAEPNCGSVFKNPHGDHAARLIEEAGGKGRRVGAASVSTKHANFIVASEGATASDVLTLVREVQDLVEERSGFLLEPEVHLLGDLDLASR